VQIHRAVDICAFRAPSGGGGPASRRGPVLEEERRDVHDVAEAHDPDELSLRVHRRKVPHVGLPHLVYRVCDQGRIPHRYVVLGVWGKR